MLTNRDGQMLVAMVLILGLLIMSFLVTAYQAHGLFLRTRGVVVRESVGAITADFNRALAAMLALATRSSFNNSRFRDFNSRFIQYGLKPGNLTSVREVATLYLNAWATAQRVVYAEHGIQISWSKDVACVSHLLGRQACILDLIYLDWNKTTSGSYICARLKLNLTNAGLYNWLTTSLIGLTLSFDEYYASNNTLRIRVIVDNGTFYGLLLARGWVEVYYQAGGKWVKANIKDVTYEGFGYYRLTLNERLGTTSLLIVVSDERGIIVVSKVDLESSQGQGKSRGRDG
ncbi:MAG: hypothetical protein N3E41_05750 [Thermofilaceae archaeon]|nr:hypothetical protein [Thermofilaceae archaeon]